MWGEGRKKERKKMIELKPPFSGLFLYDLLDTRMVLKSGLLIFYNLSCRTVEASTYYTVLQISWADRKPSTRLSR